MYQWSSASWLFFLFPLVLSFCSFILGYWTTRSWLDNALETRIFPLPLYLFPTTDTQTPQRSWTKTRPRLHQCVQTKYSLTQSARDHMDVDSEGAVRVYVKVTVWMWDESEWFWFWFVIPDDFSSCSGLCIVLMTMVCCCEVTICPYMGTFLITSCGPCLSVRLNGIRGQKNFLFNFNPQLLGPYNLQLCL